MTDSEAVEAKPALAPAAKVPDVAEEDMPSPVKLDGPPVRRRLYIRKEVEFVRYGYTEGCPGCLKAASKRSLCAATLTNIS